MQILTLDLSELEEPGNFLELRRKIKFDDLYFRGEKIEIPAPLNLELTIMLSDDVFVLTGELWGKLVLSCSRCLEKFNRDFKVHIDEELRKEDIEDLKKVRVTELLQKNIFLSIPIKHLCREECKGLCPECGQNLNEGECDCEPGSVDPRLASLKDYFDGDDE
ncbi:MAG: YceD family protein [Halanaerobiaceae bacterium]